MDFKTAERPEFCNALSFICVDFFCVMSKGELTTIRFDQVSKIRLDKDRNALKNKVFFSLALLIVGLYLYYSTLSFLPKILLVVCAASFFLIAVFQRMYRYLLVVHMKDAKVLKIQIDEVHNKEAKEIVCFVKRKMRNMKFKE